MTDIKFAAIGIQHDHIYGQCNCLIRAGAKLVSYFETDEAFAREFGEKYPDAKRVTDPAAILEDGSIGVVVTAAISAQRAAIAITAMQHGKDVLSDKPGMTSFDQLAEVKRAQAETGRIYNILYSEHFENRATVKAGELVANGAIGEVIHTVGLGPHRLRKPTRPGWFFDRSLYGGILTDIASHQCEQFLFFANRNSAKILSASVSNRANPDNPGLQDSGDIHMATDNANGLIHVDWFTPEGLPSWGDGRLMITGTHGAIEIRKNIDIGGREGANHLFLTDKKEITHIDCNDVDLPFGKQFLSDIRDRTETAIPQGRVFNAMELALSAQEMAEDIASSEDK